MRSVHRPRVLTLRYARRIPMRPRRTSARGISAAGDDSRARYCDAYPPTIPSFLGSARDLGRADERRHRPDRERNSRLTPRGVDSRMDGWTDGVWECEYG
ncbi:hypothetical protein EVAR_77352_1 [Eumeta japonica]|uniref:Uncharacterized protein n=1 Tax=Eumeta variegata TaxID=151549 RepID=A0A4C1UYG8_EUMVA|nr:hypothetical protein EVAR_77352_1 [Eumeta japonica]